MNQEATFEFSRGLELHKNDDCREKPDGRNFAEPDAPAGWLTVRWDEAEVQFAGAGYGVAYEWTRIAGFLINKNRKFLTWRLHALEVVFFEPVNSGSDSAFHQPGWGWRPIIYCTPEYESAFDRLIADLSNLALPKRIWPVQVDADSLAELARANGVAE